MTDAFMQAHLQRATDTLQMPETKKQIEALFDATYMIEKGQYAQSGKLLQGILKTQNQNKSAKYSSFVLEVKFNMILTELYGARQYPINIRKLMQKFTFVFQNLLKQIEKHEEAYTEQEDEQQWPYGNYLRIRIYTTLLQLSAKSGLGNQYGWIEELISLLTQQKMYLPEVMGKLCGCKDLKGFCLNFNSDQILQNDQQLPPEKKKTPFQKAKIIDIASTWFILGSQFQKGIKLKEKALSLWKSANSLKEHEKCEMQYMQLKSNSNSQFCTRLKRLAKIITKILKGVEDPQKPIKKQDKQMSVIVKKGLAKTMRQIDKFNEQLDIIQDEISKANKKKSIWSSSKKSTVLSTKKSLLNDSKLFQYYQKADEFRTQCYAKQDHQEITSLLENSSKFIVDQKKVISKAIVPLVQLYTKRRKWAFLTWKNWYIVKFGMLNKDFLSSLPLNKLTEKKNSSPQSKKLTSSADKKIEESDQQPFQSMVQTFGGQGRYLSFKDY